MDAVSELIWTGSYGSTTIDQICDKAGVKKGSFYYFFESKADVAVAAIDRHWQQFRSELDAIFSPTVPPLERLRKFCENGYAHQAQRRTECGCVLGCPLFSLGAEVSTQEAALKAKIQEILEYRRSYLASAIRDAHAAGHINAPDANAKARILFAYYEGLLTAARIENDLSILKEAVNGTYEILGVTAPVPA